MMEIEYSRHSWEDTSEVMEKFDEVEQMLKDLGYDFTTDMRTYEMYLNGKLSRRASSDL